MATQNQTEMKMDKIELLERIHEIYESHTGGVISLPEEKEHVIKRLLSGQEPHNAGRTEIRTVNGTIMVKETIDEIERQLGFPWIIVTLSNKTHTTCKEIHINRDFIIQISDGEQNGS